MVYRDLQVRVLGLVTTATRNSHFTELGLRDYPKIFDFFVGGAPEILTILGFSPPRLSGGWLFPALGPPRSGPLRPLSRDKENPKIVTDIKTYTTLH